MSESLVLAPQAQLAERPEQVIARIRQARELVVAIQKEVMKPGIHFGILPGTDKPVLLKEGADVLNMAFRLSPREEEVLDLSGPDERRYKVTVAIYQEDLRRLGFGVGTCSTSEDKYKWRKAYQNEYDASPADRRRVKSGEKDGRKWTTIQIRTEPADLDNTVLQMATKRALVQATRQVHAVSDIFADITLEDLPEELRDQLLLGNKTARPKVAQPKPASSPPAATAEVATGSAPAAALIPSGAWQPAKDRWHAKGVISEAQAKRLIAIGTQNGWTAAEIRAEVKTGLGVDLSALPYKDPYDLTVGLFATARPQV